MSRILIIDDEPKLRDLLARILSLENYEVFKAENAKKGLEILENQLFELIIMDVRLPDANGVELSKSIKEKYPFTEILVMTAYGTIQDGVAAMRNGAYDYLVKGDNNEQMLVVIPKAIEKSILAQKVALLEKKVKQSFEFKDLIGENKVFREALQIAQKVALTDANVLILGETGTGKELFAEAIHNASPRRDYSLVAINCAAIPKDLLESELFGYKKGAFSGALQDKKGLLEEAHNGTLFLDEIGEMSIDLQAKILRVLDTQQFIKIGDTKPIKVNIRIISATNRNLTHAIEKEVFRADLFYRLGVISLHLPALRERKEDIELLVRHFIEVFSAKLKQKISEIESQFLENLKNYAFPGNIRELRNIVERALILNTGQILKNEALPQEVIFKNLVSKKNNIQNDLSLENLEKSHIQQVMISTNGNKTKAAELLGIGLTTLYRKIQEYGLE